MIFGCSACKVALPLYDSAGRNPLQNHSSALITREYSFCASCFNRYCIACRKKRGSWFRKPTCSCGISLPEATNNADKLKNHCAPRSTFDTILTDQTQPRERRDLATLLYRILVDAPCPWGPGTAWFCESRLLPKFYRGRFESDNVWVCDNVRLETDNVRDVIFGPSASVIGSTWLVCESIIVDSSLEGTNSVITNSLMAGVKEFISHRSYFARRYYGKHFFCPVIEIVGLQVFKECKKGESLTTSQDELLFVISEFVRLLADDPDDRGIATVFATSIEQRGGKLGCPAAINGYCDTEPNTLVKLALESFPAAENWQRETLTIERKQERPVKYHFYFLYR